MMTSMLSEYFLRLLSLQDNMLGLLLLVSIRLCWAQVIVSSYAALGDSYPAGIGAGGLRLLPPAEAWCSQHSKAYPLQVADDYRIAVQEVKHLACGGAITTSTLLTQVPRIGNSDVVTIQVGGNEAGFFGLLNECIQQWYPVSTCEDELVKARKLVQSSEMIDRFNQLVVGAQRASRPETALIIMGYARFFNEDTDECDRISFSTTNPENVLTKELRKKFNGMINSLNEMIKAVAEAHGVTYLDVDSSFHGHRFCEAGTGRLGIGSSWFFNDFETNWREQLNHDGVSLQQAISVERSSKFFNLTRTFHPTTEGHGAIANTIVELLLRS